MVTFRFSEIIDASTVKGAQFTFVSARTVGAASYTLKGGESSSRDWTEIRLNLTKTDFDNLQGFTDLVTGRNDIFITLIPESVLNLTDMNNNLATAVAAPDAIQVTLFTDDTRAAQLIQFNVSLDTATITLEFSETMNASSVDASQLVLQSIANSSDGLCY